MSTRGSAIKLKNSHLVQRVMCTGPSKGYNSASEYTGIAYRAEEIAFECRGSGKGYSSASEYTGIRFGAEGSRSW